MTISNYPEQKLIEAQVRWIIFYDDADKKPEMFTDKEIAYNVFRRRLENWNCYLFVRDDVVQSELAELREKAETLDYLTGKRPWRLWAMVTDANGKIPDDCPVTLKNVLDHLIAQKEQST